MRTLQNCYKEIDIFGSEIQFRFKGQPTYKTYLGSSFTLTILILVSLRLISIVTDVFERNSPDVLFQERLVDSPEVFVVNKDTFQLAFGMQDSKINYYINNSIYTATLTQNTKVTKLNSQTGLNEDVWTTREIPLQHCQEENFANEENKRYFLSLNYKNMLCMKLDEFAEIQGDFTQNTFQYLRLKLSKCKVNCADNTVIDSYLKNASFAMMFSDIFVDTTQKDKPFKSYARDVFWKTSMDISKHVQFDIRNNYVESNYGWILDDIQTQHFPSFTKAEVISTSTDTSDYFIDVIFRFEKQRESIYKRRYKTLNSIMSEIGGFTQTLLAIGFILFQRLSSLHLSKSIINQAFTFDHFSEDPVEGDDDDQNFLQKSIDNTPIFSQNPQLSNINNNNQEKNYEQSAPTNQNNLEKQQNSGELKQSDIKLRDVSDSDIISIQGMNCQSGLISPAGGNSLLLPQQQQHEVVVSTQLPNRRLEQDRYQSKQLQIINKNIITSQQKQNQNNKKLELTMIQSQNDIPQQLIVSPCNLSNSMLPCSNMKINQQNENNQQLQNHLNHHNNNVNKPTKTSFMNRNINKNKDNKNSNEGEEDGENQKQGILKKFMAKLKKKINISTKEYFFYFLWPFGKTKQKKAIIDYSLDRLYEHLDALYVINKLMEVEKLKRVIFNSNQLNMFEMLPKPTIRTNVFRKDNPKNLKMEVDNDYISFKTQEQKLQSAYSSYVKVISKSDKSALDDKLISMMDKDHLLLFKKFNKIDKTYNINNQSYNYNIIPSPLIGSFEQSLQNKYASLQVSQSNIQKKIQFEELKKQKSEISASFSDNSPQKMPELVSDSRLENLINLQKQNVNGNNIDNNQQGVINNILLSERKGLLEQQNQQPQEIQSHLSQSAQSNLDRIELQKQLGQDILLNQEKNINNNNKILNIQDINYNIKDKVEEQTPSRNIYCDISSEIDDIDDHQSKQINNFNSLQFPFQNNL